LPESPPPVPAAAPSPAHFPTPTPEPETPLHYVDTPVDEFGVYRSYPELPDSIPDEEVAMADVCEGAGFPVPPPSNPLSIFGTHAKKIVDNVFAPFLNATVFRLMEWFYNENQTKSIADLNNLVNNVLLPDDFQQEHLRGFSAQKVLKDMDDFGGPKEFLQPDDGWIESSVRIPVPCSGVKQLEKDAPTYELKGIFYRKPLEVVKSVFQSPESKKFHYTPFRLYQQHFSESSNTHESVRLHSELYNSDSFLDEHEKVQRQQRERLRKNPEDPSLHVPNALAAMMLWSDATQVGTWGDESMWPVYLYFGNQSKYDRAKPSSFAAHHLAYIPKVSIYCY
ncbi:hypothetical protein FB446DRAFT_656093, partial [Lentinula raphanica]